MDFINCFRSKGARERKRGERERERERRLIEKRDRGSERRGWQWCISWQARHAGFGFVCKFPNQLFMGSLTGIAFHLDEASTSSIPPRHPVSSRHGERVRLVLVLLLFFLSVSFLSFVHDSRCSLPPTHPSLPPRSLSHSLFSLRIRMVVSRAKWKHEAR